MLHQWAYDIKADEIVVPDSLGDADATIHMARDFEDYVGDDFDYMGVIQGRTAQEVAWCMNQWIRMSWVDVIAVPRILVHNLYMQARVDIIETLVDKFAGRFKAIHALGSSSWIQEAISIRAAGARSMDTSMPAVIGLHERTLAENEYYSRPVDFFEWQPTVSQEKYIIDNCNEFIKYAKASPGELRELSS
jgi:hypothetical protein